MEHKYYNRAIEILGDELFIVDGELYIDTGGNVIIDAMCQLAEEVEKDHKENYTELLTKYNLALKQLNSLVSISYTKEEVEELLEKQRELCAIEAKVKTKRVFKKNDYDFESTFIDRDSILNAKLKLE